MSSLGEGSREDGGEVTTLLSSRGTQLRLFPVPLEHDGPECKFPILKGPPLTLCYPQAHHHHPPLPGSFSHSPSEFRELCSLLHWPDPKRIRGHIPEKVSHGASPSKQLVVWLVHCLQINRAMTSSLAGIS